MMKPSPFQPNLFRERMQFFQTGIADQVNAVGINHRSIHFQFRVSLILVPYRVAARSANHRKKERDCPPSGRTPAPESCFTPWLRQSLLPPPSPRRQKRKRKKWKEKEWEPCLLNIFRRMRHVLQQGGAALRPCSGSKPCCGATDRPYEDSIVPYGVQDTVVVNPISRPKYDVLTDKRHTMPAMNHTNSLLPHSTSAAFIRYYSEF
jgi:hypothetical protein